MEKITVFVPNYNKQKYISQALNSILMQKTNFQYKILIIDDASTDNSVETIKRYVKKYPKKIDFIQNEKNIRCLANLIKGYKLIKTKYFCILDPDDYWINKNKLQKAVDFLDKHNDFTIYMSNIYVKERNKKLVPYINSKTKDFDFKDLDNAILCQTSGAVFRYISGNVPNVVSRAIGNVDEKIYEGDSFRDLTFLKLGKAHFENQIESVYRINKTGIWTSLNIFQKNLLNARFFLKMFLFFKENQDYFIKMSLYFLSKNIELLDNNKKNISDNDIFETKKWLIECIKYKNPKLKLKNQIKIIIYSLFFSFKKNKKARIEIVKKIQDIIKI